MSVRSYGFFDRDVFASDDLRLCCLLGCFSPTNLISNIGGKIVYGGTNLVVVFVYVSLGYVACSATVSTGCNYAQVRGDYVSFAILHDVVKRNSGIDISLPHPKRVEYDRIVYQFVIIRILVNKGKSVVAGVMNRNCSAAARYA